MKRQDPKTTGLFLSLLIILLTVVMVVFPLFTPGFPETDDGDWMIIRLSAFYQSLTEGQLPVRYLGRLNYNFGYPVANFLYPGFMYAGSVLRYLGFSYADAVKALLVIFVGILSFSLYGFLSVRFSRWAATAGTVIAVLSPYLSYDIYKRGSVGEVMAMAMAAATMMALERGYTTLIPLGIALLTVSHNSLAVILTGVIAGYMVFSGRISALPHLIAGLIMSAFFILPAIIESRYVVFSNTVISNPFEYFVAGANFRLTNLIILSALLLIPVTVWKKLDLTGRFMTIAIVVVYALATPVTAPFWTLGILERFVQFPYRFLAVEILIGGYLVALILDSRKKILSGWISGLVILAGSLAWFAVRPPVNSIVKPEGFYTTNEATTTVAGEYMPVWVTEIPTVRAPVKAELIGSPGTVVQAVPGSDEMNFTVTADNDAILRINKIYYPGWGIRIDGIPQPIRTVPGSGIMEIDIQSGIHSVFSAFRETPGRFLADGISIASFLVYYGIWGIRFALGRRGPA